MTESQPATQDAAVFRVLVADRLGQPGLDRLVEEPTVDVDVRTGLAEQDLTAMIGDYDGLIVRSGTRVTAGLLEAGDRLRVVGRAGIGVDNVDLDTATRRGIVVMKPQPRASRGQGMGRGHAGQAETQDPDLFA